MRENKIVSFSVVMLLVTVSLAGVAATLPSQVAAQQPGIMLSAAANLASVAINEPFTINGTLIAPGCGTFVTPIAGASIQLQQNVSGTWQNVTGATNTTNATGAYGISTSEPAVGTYHYQTIFAGLPFYANATSNVVTVTVVSGTQSTQLGLSGVQIHVTRSSLPAKVAITYAFSGTLATTQPKPVGIANAKIVLQWSKDNKNWSPFSPTPAVTNANGAYVFKGSLAPGTYYFRTAYNGSSQYAASFSRVVKVSVSSTGSSVESA
jgi:hypothetical protein